MPSMVTRKSTRAPRKFSLASVLSNSSRRSREFFQTTCEILTAIKLSFSPPALARQMMKAKQLSLKVKTHDILEHQLSPLLRAHLFDSQKHQRSSSTIVELETGPVKNRLVVTSADLLLLIYENISHSSSLMKNITEEVHGISKVARTI